MSSFHRKLDTIIFLYIKKQGKMHFFPDKLHNTLYHIFLLDGRPHNLRLVSRLLQCLDNLLLVIRSKAL